MKTLFGEKGFTLIEMLLVLTLIAAIVGVALPSFRSMQQEGNMTRATGDLRTLQTAIESYRIHNDAYPATGDLSPLTDAVPTVVTSLPTDPFTSGEDYTYDLNDDGHYIIYSEGPSGDSEPSITDGEVDAEPGDVWVSNCQEAAGS